MSSDSIHILLQISIHVLEYKSENTEERNDEIKEEDDYFIHSKHLLIPNMWLKYKPISMDDIMESDYICMTEITEKRHLEMIEIKNSKRVREKERSKIIK